GADAAVAGVGDVHAVHDVVVVEAAGAGHRGVGAADAAAAAHAGDQVESVGEVASDRDPFQCLGVENAAHGRGGGVDDRRGGHDLDDLFDRADLEDETGQLEALAQADVDVLLLHR